MASSRLHRLAFGLVLSAASCQPATERVLRLEELTYTDIDQLDRSRTVVVLTFGNLEEHGPHLPVGSDYFQAVAFRDGIVERLTTVHPDYSFLIAPVVPLGEGGANDLAGQLDHVGTFGVRFETLRDVAIDLGSAVARQGFRNIFIVHMHGMPLHSIAFTDASAYVSDRYTVRMVNLSSLVFGEGFYSDSVLEKHLGKDWEQRIGFEGHAGAAETAANLAVRPEFVKEDYTGLKSFKARNLDEVLRTYQNPTGWLGYWGSPAEASPALGKDLMSDLVGRGVRLAEKALAGDDLTKLPLWPDVLPRSGEVEVLFNRNRDSYASRTADVKAWLEVRERKE